MTASDQVNDPAKVVVNFEPVDLDQPARDAVLDTTANPSHLVRMVPPAKPTHPPMVLGDEAGLRQVLANLLRNAVVHTRAGTMVVLVVATGRSACRPSRGVAPSSP